ncbi:hypothetical protein H0H81_000142 [Sphagnurus paluster]|uniref:Uncharacterized protein n=1 Tax=Sphagnurus paluster TaxID=117069 RepID=A0A9P7GMY0_9AGAR|nr:hypothetical protein H0H81_000142 [Sphagnurus paluster]
MSLYGQDTHRLLETASHEALVRSGNVAYSQLGRRVIVLEAELNNTKQLYDSLLQQFSASTNSSNSMKAPLGSTNKLVPYRRDDFPKVTIWTASKWTNSTKSHPTNDAGIHQHTTSASRDHPTRASMGYIQDRNGNAVSTGRAKSISSHARSIWRNLAHLDLAPTSWKKALPEASNFFRQEMYAFCDDLRLCENDWKVEYLAVHLYTGWYRAIRDAKKEMKQEPDSDLQQIRKRCASSELTKPKQLKKRHKEEREPSQEIDDRAMDATESPQVQLNTVEPTFRLLCAQTPSTELNTTENAPSVQLEPMGNVDGIGNVDEDVEEHWHSGAPRDEECQPEWQPVTTPSTEFAHSTTELIANHPPGETKSAVTLA